MYFSEFEKKLKINSINNIITTSLIKFYKSRVDVFIALTNALKSLYIKSGYKKSNIIVIPNAIDPIFLSNNKNIINENNIIKVLFVGQLSPKKGILDLLKAYSDSEILRAKTKLLILGNGKLKKEIISFIEKNNLTNVKIREFRYENLPNEYKKNNVLVSPSNYFEPFSRTWLEAIANNLIVLSSNNPSAIELFNDKFYFYKMGNVDSLRNELEKIIKNPNIKTYDLKSYKIKGVIQQIIELYR